ncbi:CmcJ/NvfI family oxidoreductase [Streptomyces sp. NPDC001941]|uniref:CmcJ/NvfI family oxidoreductase n=1 Tax=Streptomyces sp. NPDC001941 TaxID=3154659 RepID=UPI0033336177
MAAVSTLLHYAAPLTPDGPQDWYIDAVSRPPEVILNFRMEPYETVVDDLREGPREPSLDEAGFQRVERPTAVDQRALADDEPEAMERYRAEVRELLTGLTGGDEVRFFDATHRRQVADAPRDPNNQSPHLRVHVDQSPRSARHRADGHGEPGRPFRRFQILNVWRPLLAPVRNYPLALCDYRSLDLGRDLVPTRLEFPAWLKDRESYSVKHNPEHRWSYWNGLSPAEAIVFKCYDSASRGLARASGEGADGELADVSGVCPHSAFLDEQGPRSGLLRTSLELRALVYHY